MGSAINLTKGSAVIFPGAILPCFYIDCDGLVCLNLSENHTCRNCATLITD